LGKRVIIISILVISLSLVFSTVPVFAELTTDKPNYSVGDNVIINGVAPLGVDEYTFELIDWDYPLFSNAVVTLFFSYRAWLSGKGWLSILIHSAWNGGLFGIDCMFDQEFGCSVFGETPEDIEYSIGSIIFSVFLLGITYWAYRWRRNRERKKKLSDF